MIIVRTPAYALFTDEILSRNFYGCGDYLLDKLMRRNLIPFAWGRDEMRFCWVLYMFQYHVHPRKQEPPVGVV